LRPFLPAVSSLFVSPSLYRAWWRRDSALPFDRLRHFAKSRSLTFLVLICKKMQNSQIPWPHHQNWDR
jgi:hypothetical protein